MTVSRRTKAYFQYWKLNAGWLGKKQECSTTRLTEYKSSDFLQMHAMTSLPHFLYLNQITFPNTNLDHNPVPNPKFNFNHINRVENRQMESQIDLLGATVRGKQCKDTEMPLRAKYPLFLFYDIQYPIFNQRSGHCGPFNFSICCIRRIDRSLGGCSTLKQGKLKAQACLFFPLFSLFFNVLLF